MTDTILKGHVSPETAYLVADYPYGFRLRCKIRYWLEYNAKHGFRFVSQTTNPKRPGEIWNKPKASTYAKLGGAMFLDENEHVQWSGLSEYGDGAQAAAWLEKFGEGVPEAGIEMTKRWIAAKLAYDSARNPGDDLAVGIAEARKAFVAPVTREQKLSCIWKNTHADFKGMTGGTRYILVLREGGTQSVPLDSLTDDEVSRKLPKQAREG